MCRLRICNMILEKLGSFIDIYWQSRIFYKYFIYWLNFWHVAVYQIPIVDGINNLLEPLTELLRLIYKNMKIPDQWSTAKTVQMR